MRATTLSLLCMLAMAARTVLGDCLSDGTPCPTSFVYPDSQAVSDIQLNCYQMPWMVGCSVWTACQKGSLGASNPYCAPFSVLADICSEKDMQSMSGCLNYAKLCAPASGSAIAQCGTSGPIPRLVSTSASQTAVVAACQEMSMPGCNECTGAATLCPDTLTSLSTVCRSMRMDQCADYNAMCASAGPNLDFFCSSTSAKFDPPMRMYFHSSIRDIILFHKWIPSNGGAYFASLLAIIFAGVFVSGIRAYRACCEAYHRINDNQRIRNNPLDESTSNIYLPGTGKVAPHLLRTALTFVMVTVDYSLMLAAMSFNVGVFFAVVGGLTLGMLLFGHIPERYAHRLQAKALLSTDIECGCAPPTLEFCSGDKTPISVKDAPLAPCCGVKVSPSSTSQDLSRSEAEVVTLIPPPQSCCGGGLEDFATSEISAEDAAARTSQSRKICCTMQPILAVEEDAEMPSADVAGAMVPQCCRM